MRTTQLPRLVNPNYGGNMAQAQGLMRTIAAVQAARLRKQAKRNHNLCGRCIGCGVRDKCDQALP
jgi:hypothetical protein